MPGGMTSLSPGGNVATNPRPAVSYAQISTNK
jgi:hypothetical protein